MWHPPGTPHAFEGSVHLYAATALTWVFAALLATAGARKITAPGATGAALQVAKLPSDLRLVRLLGAGEIALAAAVLGFGGMAPAALLAVTYGVFAAFARRQSRKGAGCGCFGETEAPASGLHVGANVLAAVAAAGASAVHSPSLWAFAVGEPLAGALAAVLVLLGAQALRLTLTALPELTAAVALNTSREADA